MVTNLKWKHVFVLLLWVFVSRHKIHIMNYHESMGMDDMQAFMKAKTSTKKEWIELKRRRLLSFTEYCGKYFILMNGGWMPRFSDQRDFNNLISTETIYALWLKTEKNLKQRNKCKNNQQ